MGTGTAGSRRAPPGRRRTGRPPRPDAGSLAPGLLAEPGRPSAGWASLRGDPAGAPGGGARGRSGTAGTRHPWGRSTRWGSSGTARNTGCTGAREDAGGSTGRGRPAGATFLALGDLEPRHRRRRQRSADTGGDDRATDSARSPGNGPPGEGRRRCRSVRSCRRCAEEAGQPVPAAPRRGGTRPCGGGGGRSGRRRPPVRGGRAERRRRDPRGLRARGAHGDRTDPQRAADRGAGRRRPVILFALGGAPAPRAAPGRRRADNGGDTSPPAGPGGAGAALRWTRHRHHHRTAEEEPSCTKAQSRS